MVSIGTLKSLEKARYSRVDIAPEEQFLKTFLVALASGNKVSELAASNRVATRWENEFTGVTISDRASC